MNHQGRHKVEFTPAELKRILRAAEAGVSHKVLGYRFGVGRDTIKALLVKARKK